MQGINMRERERVNESNANNKMCFEVRAPSSTSPPSPRRISNPLGVPNSSLNQYNLQWGNTITTSHTRGRPVAKQPQITSTEEGYKLTPTPPHQEGVNQHLNLYQRGSIPTISTSTKEGAIHHSNQPLPKRDTTNQGGFLQQVVYLNHKPIPFSTKQMIL